MSILSIEIRSLTQKLGKSTTTLKKGGLIGTLKGSVWLTEFRQVLESFVSPQRRGVRRDDSFPLPEPETALGQRRQALRAALNSTKHVMPNDLQA